MQKRKGFTLVELVIVIAVIAILAGVLIGTFASVINRANESARLQAVKAQEIEQKADDILKKIEDSNWYGWEDFETSIVSKLEVAFEKAVKTSTPMDETSIKAVFVEAMNEYAKNHASENTSLTEEQVQAIVENALGTFNFGGVTEAQVRAIVNTAVERTAATQLTAAQVKTIVNTANANNLTAADVSKIFAEKIAELSDKYSATAEELKGKIDAATASLSANAITEEQVATILEGLLPVTVRVTSSEQFVEKVTTLNSFSTIIVDFAPESEDIFNVAFTGIKTLIINSNYTLPTLNIDAPNGTVFVLARVTNLNVINIADNSLHIHNEITKLTINSGRAVVEDGGTVGTLTAQPLENSTVTVQIEQKGKIDDLVAQYQTVGENVNNYIYVENAGKVTNAKLTTVNGWTDETNTTNLRVTNKPGATGTEIADVETDSTTQVKILVIDENNNAGKLYGVKQVTPSGSQDPQTQCDELDNQYHYWVDLHANSFAGGTGTDVDPYQISDGFEFSYLAYLVNNGIGDYNEKSYVLVNNIDLSGKCWAPISYYFRSVNTYDNALFKGTFNGQNYTITGLNDANARYFTDVIAGINDSTPLNGEEYVYGLFGTVNGAKLKNVSFENVNIKAAIGEGTDIVNDIHYLGDAIATLCGATKGTVTITNVHVNSGSISGYDEVGGIVGRRQTGSIVFDNCSNGISVTAVRRSGGILCTQGSGAYAFKTEDGTIKLGNSDYTNIIATFKNCSNSGTIKSLGKLADYSKKAFGGYYGAAIITHTDAGAFSTAEKFDSLKNPVDGFTNTGSTITIINNDYTLTDTCYLFSSVAPGSATLQAARVYNFDPTMYINQTVNNNTVIEETTTQNIFEYIDSNNNEYTVVVTNNGDGTWTVVSTKN